MRTFGTISVRRAASRANGRKGFVTLTFTDEAVYNATLVALQARGDLDVYDYAFAYRLYETKADAIETVDFWLD